MSTKRPIHPLIQILITLSLIVLPLLTAMPVAAGGAVDLWINSATDSPDPVLAGQTLTYSFNVRGQTVGVGAFLEDVKFYLYLSPYVTPTGVGTPDYSILPDGSVLWDLGSYTVGASFSRDISLEVRVNHDAVAQMGGLFDLVTTAWVTSDNENRMNTNDAQAVLRTSVQERANLAVTKVRVPDLLPNYIQAGQTILYEVTILNNGPSAARSVYLWDWVVENDPLRDLELISSSVPCQTLVGAAGSNYFNVTPTPANAGGENVYACYLGTVGAGETRVVQFLFRVPSGMPPIQSNDIANWAIVASSTKVYPKLVADFLTPDPDGPAVWGPGPYAYNPVTFSDNLGVARDTNVWASPDIAVAKTSWPNPVVAGEKVWYQITVTNNGPSDAGIVNITDTLPIDVQYIADDDACTLSLGTGPGGADQVLCQLSSLAAGASATITIEGYVDPAAYYNRLAAQPAQQPRLANTVCASIIEVRLFGDPVYVDPDQSNNCALHYTFLDESADLRITKVSKPDDIVRAGETFTYTIYVDNYGPSGARNVVITDTLLSSGAVTIQSCAFSVSQGGGVITQFTCTTGPLVSTHFGADVGTFATNYLDPRSPTAQGRLRASFRLVANEAIDVNNLSTVVAETPDPDMSNNEAWDAISVMAVADLAVTKASGGDVVAGDVSSWTVTVTNNGPSTAENVVVTDLLNWGLVNGSVEVTGLTQGACTLGTPGDPTDPLVCNLGTMTPGQVIQFTILADVDPAYVALQPRTPASLFIDNNVMVDSDTFDDDNSNNRAVDFAGVSAAADLKLAKFTIGTPVAGTVIHYELSIENEGPSVAESVILRDFLPPGVHFLSASVLLPGMVGQVPLACTLTQGSNAVFCPLGDVAPTGGVPILVFVNVLIDPSVLAGETLLNVADVYLTDTTDPDLSNNAAFASVGVGTEANLVATKTSVPQKVVAGEQVKYVLTVTNNGPSDAQDVNVIDHLGTMTDVLAFEVTSDPTCQLDPNGHVNCQWGTLPAGATRSVDIWARVLPEVEPGTILLNEVAVGSTTPPYLIPDEGDPDTRLWTAVETYVLSTADLRITKFGKMDGEVRAGDNLTYTIIVDNLGPSWAWDVTVKEALRSSGDFEILSMASNLPYTTNMAPGWYTQQADFEIWLDDPLPVSGPGGAGRWIITIVVTANETQDINNSAQVLAGRSLDPDWSNNYALVQHDITDVSDLLVDKIAWGDVFYGMTADQVVAGLKLTYTLTVGNLGPSTAENVVLQDRIPAWLVVTGVDASQGACNTGTSGSWDDKLVCGLGTLAVGEQATVVVYIDVPSWVPAGTILENDVQVYSDIFDPINANNYDYNLTTVSTVADLWVEKDEEPDPVVAGEILDWAYVVGNNGPSDAVSVIAVDTLPAEVEFLSASVALGGANCTYSQAWHLVTCDLGTLGAGQAVGVLIRTMVKSSAEEGYITNTVTVASNPMGWALPTPDPDGANNIAWTDTMVINRADLSIAKVGLPEKVYAGEQIRYQITVMNNGSSDARDVIVTDVLDDQVAFELTNGDCAYDAESGEADCGYMTAGTSKSFYVWVRVDADVEPGTTIYNTAVVESETTDPDEANNSVTIGNYVESKADLRITKFGKMDGEVRAGDNLTYTIIVDNLGPSWAWDVTVKEALRSSGDFEILSMASNLPYTTNMAPGWYTQQADFEIWLDDPLPVGGPDGAGRWIITIVVTANETQDINNSAQVLAGRSLDPDWSNNYALVQHDITDVSDLSVVKTAMGWAYEWDEEQFGVVPAEDSAIAGWPGGIVYTMVVDNAGPSTAENVVLRDRLPAWVVVTGYEATQGSCVTGTPGSATDLLTCGLGTIVPGGVATVTVYAQVPYWVPEGTILENDVQVYSDIYDPDNSGNYDTNLSMVYAFADLMVEKEGPTAINAGEVIEYTIYVTNMGVSTAQTVVIMDALPAQVTYLSHQVVYGAATCAPMPYPMGTALVCDAADLDPGEEIVVTIKGVVDADYLGDIVNSVMAMSQTTDPDMDNNRDTVTTAVDALTDLKVTKADTPDPVIAGQMLYYAIVAKNDGPSDATGVWLTDTLPVEVTFVDATEGGVYDAGTHTITWYLGDMPAGTSQLVEVHVQVNSDARIVMVGPLANTVVVTGNEQDPNIANNTYVEETFVNDLADLRIIKVGKPDAHVRAGEALVYTIYVDNLGPSDARDVIVTDNILSSGVFDLDTGSITMSQGTWAIDPLTGALIFDLGILPAGERATIGMIVSADEPQDVNNIVSVFATTPDPDYSNNETMVMTAIDAVSDLGIVKTVVGGDLIAGTSVIYEVVVWNDGPSTAENVVVKDWLPGGTVPMGDPVGLPMGAQYTLGTPGDPTAPAILNLGTLAPGEVYTITIELAIDPSYGPNLLANDVEIYSDMFDPENGNNRSTAVILVEDASELLVVKWDDADPVLAGETVEYFIGIANNGPSTARGVRFFDWITGAEWLTLKEYQIGNGSGYCLANSTWDTVDCFLGDILPGDYREVYLTFAVSPDAPDGTMVFDQLEVVTDSPFEFAEDSDLDEDTTISNEADLEITKSVSPAPVAYTGEGVAYEITVTNLGPGTAFGVVVTDQLPEGITYVLDTAGCTEDEGEVTCDLGDIAVGQSRTITIYANVDVDAEPGIYTNEAMVEMEGESVDPNEANNVATADVEVQGKADLKVIKFGKPEGEVRAGDLLTYTIVVDNFGPGEARGVTIHELLAAGGTTSQSNAYNLISVSSERPMTPSALSGTFGEAYEFDLVLDDPLEVGGRWTVTVVVQALEGVDINNCATVSSDYWDPDLSNNEACADHTFIDVADLAIAKFAYGEFIEGCEYVNGFGQALRGQAARTQNGGGWYTSENEVTAGGWLYYDLVVTNKGPSTAENVVVVDRLPLGVQYQGAIYWRDGQEWPADCTVNQALDTVTCNLGTLAAGEQVVVWIDVTVPSWMPMGTALWNNAFVYSDIYDPDNSNDAATNRTEVYAIAEVSVEKISVPETALPGQQITYLITVENHGLSDAPGTWIHDMVPPEISGVAWTAEFYGGATGKPAGNWGIHEMVNLPAGGKVVYTVKGILDTYWPVSNVVEVQTAFGVYDRCEENNVSEDVNEPKLNFLPIIRKEWISSPPLPNLVVERIVATPNAIQVDIKNVGTAPVFQPFWVDLYLNPPATPTRVNQIWNDPEGDGTYCAFPICQGLAWGVLGNWLPLLPGQTLVLRVDDNDPYAAIQWPLRWGDFILAQVDSWNPETDYGTVIETHEAYGGPYDNIRWATRVLWTLPGGAGQAAVAGSGATFQGLPERP